MVAKLRQDYTNDPVSAKIEYMVTRTEGDANLTIQPWAEEHLHTATEEEMWTFLDWYKDPHCRERAMDQLNNIRQGKEDVRKYHARFNRYRLEARTNFDDLTLKTFFTRGLTEELQRQLAGVNSSTTYVDLVEKTFLLDDNLRRIDRNVKKMRGNPPPVPSSTRTSGTDQKSNAKLAADPDAMDWEPTKRVGTQRAAWVSKAEIQRRRKNNWCIQCGDSEHFIRECPYLPAVRPSTTRTNTVKLTARPQLVDAADADLDTETESGKE